MEDSQIHKEMTVAAGQFTRERDYWLNRLSGEPVKTGFPYDYTPGGKQRETANIASCLPLDVCKAAIKLSNQSDARLYMVLAAVLVLLLERYTGHWDIIIGTPVPRQDREGDFINAVLCLRNQVHPGMTFRQLLMQVRQTVIEANAHQNYPIETLVYQLNLHASKEDFPLFDTAVLLENIQSKEYLQRIPLNMVFAFHRDNESIHLQVRYNRALYREAAVQRLITHYISLLDQALANPDAGVIELDPISGEEKRSFLADFNQTKSNFPRDKTLPRLFTEQVKKTPDHTALARVHQTHEKRKKNDSSYMSYTSHISYKELNEKANQLAALLIQKGVQPDTIVGLTAERSIEMVIAVLGILKAGGAYLPIDPEYPEERKQYMLADSRAKFLVTTPGLVEKYGKLSIVNCQLLMVNSINNYQLTINNSQLNSSNLCYILYTSGTTGRPKGVMIEHQGVVNYICWAIQNYIKGEKVVFPLYTSLSFDLTITSLFSPLLTGNTLVVYPGDTTGDAFLIEKILADNFAAVIKLTPSHLKLIKNKKIETGFSCSIKRFIVGGEQLHTSLALDISNNFNGRIEIYNEYGPTEASVGCMIHRFDPGVSQGPVVPIGIPAANVQIYLLDLFLRPVPVGAAGEIHISGPGLARGYLNRPELTAEKFLTSFYRTYKSYMTYIPGKLYQTGDLARWLPDNIIEFIGRKDQQVKIRGYRIELAEIQQRLLSHPAVKEALVVTGQDQPGNHFLCAYVVTDGETARLQEYLEQHLPEYMVPGFFVSLDRIPLTANGKIDRRALPAPGPQITGELIKPSNEIESKLVETWSDLLGIEKDALGVNQNFFKLGGHSLTITILAARLHKELHIDASLAELYNHPTIRDMAQLVAAAKTKRFEPIHTVEKKEYYPLSPAQKRLYILQQLDVQGIGYNIPEVLVLEGRLDEKRLGFTFNRLFARHESFRTGYRLVREEPVQCIYDPAPFNIRYYNIPADALKVETAVDRKNSIEIVPGAVSGIPALEDIIKQFVKPFDLGRPPLLRVGLIKTGKPGFHFLLIDMHHIACDGTSRGIFVEEFMSLFSGAELPRLSTRYKDFCLWQQAQWDKEKPIIEKQEAYWLEEFSEEVPLLNLPYDYPRPAIQKFDGSIELFEIKETGTAVLKELAGQQGTTLFMLLLSLLNLLLSRLSGQEEIVIGTPTAARRHADLEQIIGMFVNTIPLKNTVNEEESFILYLEKVKEKTVAASENQEYPFEELVDKVIKDRDTSRNPLFDVMFSLQNMWIPEMEIPGLKLKPYLYEYTTAKFDLNLDVVETGNRLAFYLEYSTHLFKRSTIQRFIRYFKTMVSAVLENPGNKLKTINLLSSPEKEELLCLSRGASVVVDNRETIHGLFEKQVEKTPDQIALTGGHQTREKSGNMSYMSDTSYLSYKKLNEKANQLARLLIEKRVRPDSVAAVMAERSIEMIIGILAILKAGGAYLGIDTTYPEERIAHMLEDSQPLMLLTHCPVERIPGKARETIEMIDLAEPGNYTGNLTDPESPTTGSNLVYVIYTSGSTGKPKGVILEHQNLVNLIQYQFKYTNLDCTRVLQFATICFDASFHEIFSALLSGGGLYLIDEETRLDIAALFRLIERHCITTLFLPMSFLKLIFSREEYIAQFPGCVRHIQTAGEQLVVSEAFRSYLQEHQVYLHNHYGPSETHVVTTLTLSPQELIPELPPIGKPIQNTGIYIISKTGDLQPVGVAGELLISGMQVGRGYLGAETAAAEKFGENTLEAQKFKERMYRSGDLACWLSDGNIRFLGRIDHQVKIRGFRVEPGEIENQLLNHHNVKEVVVTANKTGNRDIYLCAYIVPPVPFDPGDFDLAELRNWLSKKLPDYMIPAYFVPLKRIPLTLNGKVNRKALPEPVFQADQNLVPPCGEIEEKLAKIWARVLDIPLQTIGRDTKFFQAGGHSLKAIILGTAIYKTFHVKIPLVEIFKTSSIRGLAAYIDEAAKDIYQSIPAAEDREYYPLSSSQKRLYILHQVETVGRTYNMPNVVILEGMLDLEKLHRVFMQLIRRHESLRTSFLEIDQKPVQRIHNQVEFEIQYLATKGHHSSFSIHHSFIRPFDLSRPPLLRVGVIGLAEDKHIFMADMHHIISDGISQQVLVREFVQLYQGEELPALRLQYRDFSRWRNQQTVLSEMKKQEAYWIKEFAGEVPLLTLPTDFPRPGFRRFEGNHARFTIESRETGKLKTLAQNREATLLMVIFALFNVLLSKLSRQEDIVLGTIIAGRPHPDLETIIGIFINILAIRTFPAPHKSFKTYLKEVKEKIINGFDHRDYQFEDLVDRVVSRRDPSRNPLFDVMFTFTPANTQSQSPAEEPRLGRESALKVKDYQGKLYQAKFDMLLSGTETKDQLVFNIEYSTSLFKPETIERFIDYFKQIVTAAVDDENKILKDIIVTHDLEHIKTDVYKSGESHFDF